MKQRLICLWLIVLFHNSQASAQAPSYPPPAPFWWSATANASLDTTTFSSEVTLNFVTDFGGVGDGDSSNVNAFASFNEYVRIRRKNIKLYIPPGTYIVGKQTINAYGYPNISLNGAPLPSDPCGTSCNRITNITITGNELAACDTPTTIIRYGTGFKYGGFANAAAIVSTNEPLNASTTFSDSGKTMASLGMIFNMTEVENVTLKNMTIDGNFYPGSLNNMNTFSLPNATSNNNTTYQPDKINLGGRWISGIGLSHFGVRMVNCKNVVLENLTIKRFGLDGIAWESTSKSICPNSIFIPTGLTIKNCTVDYNGRNGISISSGQDILIKNSRITNTAQGLASAPAAGIDFEDDGNTGKIGTVTANIRIDSTLIWNNLSAGFFASFGVSSIYDAQISNSDIISALNKDSYGFKIEKNSKNFRFIKTAIMGQTYAANLSASSSLSFDSCIFLDKYRIDSCVYEKSIPIDATASNYFGYFNTFSSVQNISITNSIFQIFKHAPVKLRSAAGSYSVFNNNKLYTTSYGWPWKASEFQYSSVNNLEYHFSTDNMYKRPAKLYDYDEGVGNTYTAINYINQNFPTANPAYIAPVAYDFPYTKYYCRPANCSAPMARPVVESDTTPDAMEKAYISISPNPVSTTLKLSGSMHKVSSYAIISADGKIVQQERINTDTLDVSQLAPGSYILNLLTPEGTESHKFIKL